MHDNLWPDFWIDVLPHMGEPDGPFDGDVDKEMLATWDFVGGMPGSSSSGSSSSSTSSSGSILASRAAIHGGCVLRDLNDRLPQSILDVVDAEDSAARLRGRAAAAASAAAASPRAATARTTAASDGRRREERERA